MKQLVNGKIIEVDDLPEPTSEEIAVDLERKKRAFIFFIQQHLDTTAQTRGYDSVDSAAKYIGKKKKTWSDEATALVDWTIDVWEAAFIILADVEAGTRPEPTVEELILELPEIVWS